MHTKRDETKKMIQILQLNEDLVSTEQIRKIRTNIDLGSNSQSNILMLTTPNNGVEVPLISAKLAISFVEQGKRVLLVDANIRNASLHHLFQISNETGLSNVILKRDNIQLHCKEKFVPGLFVLPAGPKPLNLSDIWVTRKVEELIRKCKSEFDMVIFEAPPFLTVSESQILADQCDGVVLVVKANKTKKEDLLKTKDTLDRMNKKILGVIYNKGK